MTAPLRRQLGLADAVTVGAGSMIGAGVFSAWSPAADAAGTGLLDRSGRRRGRRLLQRHLVGTARRAAPGIGRHVRLRPPPARCVLGPPRRVGLHRRQDRLVRRHRADRRRLPVARTGTPRRRRRRRRRGARQHRRADTHRHRHQVPPRRRTGSARRGRRRRLVEPDRLPGPHRARSTRRHPTSCAPAGSCSSPSPATPASPPWAKRSATRPRPSPRPSPGRWPASS